MLKILYSNYYIIYRLNYKFGRYVLEKIKLQYLLNYSLQYLKSNFHLSMDTPTSPQCWDSIAMPVESFFSSTSNPSSVLQWSLFRVFFFKRVFLYCVGMLVKWVFPTAMATHNPSTFFPPFFSVRTFIFYLITFNLQNPCSSKLTTLNGIKSFSPFEFSAQIAISLAILFSKCPKSLVFDFQDQVCDIWGDIVYKEVVFTSSAC